MRAAPGAPVLRPPSPSWRWAPKSRAEGGDEAAGGRYGSDVGHGACTWRLEGRRQRKPNGPPSLPRMGCARAGGPSSAAASTRRPSRSSLSRRAERSEGWAVARALTATGRARIGPRAPRARKSAQWTGGCGSTCTLVISRPLAGPCPTRVVAPLHPGTPPTVPPDRRPIAGHRLGRRTPGPARTTRPTTQPRRPPTSAVTAVRPPPRHPSEPEKAHRTADNAASNTANLRRHRRPPAPAAPPPDRRPRARHQQRRLRRNSWPAWGPSQPMATGGPHRLPQRRPASPGGSTPSPRRRPPRGSRRSRPPGRRCRSRACRSPPPGTRAPSSPGRSSSSPPRRWSAATNASSPA